jgi:hypothetical protein
MGLSRNQPKRTRNGVTNNEICTDEPIVIASASFILFVHTSSTAVTHSACPGVRLPTHVSGEGGEGVTSVADDGDKY